MFPKFLSKFLLPWAPPQFPIVPIPNLEMIDHSFMELQNHLEPRNLYFHTKNVLNNYLANGTSRYLESLKSFFVLFLGHFR